MARTKKAYGEIYRDPLAIQALIDLREYAGNTKLHPIPHGAIASGKRLLVAFIDSCGFGTGYVLMSIELATFQTIDMNDAKKMTEGFQVHAVHSKAYPLQFRWLRPDFSRYESCLFGVEESGTLCSTSKRHAQHTHHSWRPSAL